MNQGIALRVGLVLDRGYQLRRLLGRGRSTEVWEAATAAGASVALKFLPCNNSATAAVAVHWLQSIRGVQHPYLVASADVWFEAGYLIVASELAEGSLVDMCASARAIAAEHVCRLLGPVAGALDFLNARRHRLTGQCVGFQHGDVHPGNLLVFGDTVKLADFGLSFVLASLLGYCRQTETAACLAPELLQGWPSDRTDQYSLAVTYCLLRGGRPPFAGVASRDSVRAVPDLTMLSAAERPVIARALLAAPRERWPSCRELIAQADQRLADAEHGSRGPPAAAPWCRGSQALPA
jgi:serine/threonine-protein kinase